MTDIVGSKSFIQVEAVNTGAPVGQSVATSMGASTNFLLRNVAQVGDIVESVLDEATFQSLRDTSWVLADGRSVAGTDYNTITGNSTLIDLRGVFRRGKDNGRGQDTNGDLTVGAYVGDQNKSHTHLYFRESFTPSPGAALGGSSTQVLEGTGASGGAEANPRYVVVNVFIKINNLP